MGKQLRADYLMIDNMSPRMRGVRRKGNPENVYQVLINNNHHGVRMEGG